MLGTLGLDHVILARFGNARGVGGQAWRIEEQKDCKLRSSQELKARTTGGGAKPKHPPFDPSWGKMGQKHKNPKTLTNIKSGPSHPPSKPSQLDIAAHDEKTPACPARLKTGKGGLEDNLGSPQETCIRNFAPKNRTSEMTVGKFARVVVAPLRDHCNFFIRGATLPPPFFGMFESSRESADFTARMLSHGKPRRAFAASLGFTSLREQAHAPSETFFFRKWNH